MLECSGPSARKFGCTQDADPENVDFNDKQKGSKRESNQAPINAVVKPPQPKFKLRDLQPCDCIDDGLLHIHVATLRLLLHLPKDLGLRYGQIGFTHLLHEGYSGL